MTGWVEALFVATACGYTVAAALYLVSLVRGAEGVGRFAPWALMLGAALHGAHLVIDGLAQSAPMPGIHQTLTFLALGIVVAFLLARLRGRGIDTLGAFLVPVALLLFLGASIERSVSDRELHAVRSALLPFHIGVNTIGIIAFALAFGAALAYVIQERMLRRKNLGGVFQRLPPLDVLDTFGLRAVSVGFPLLSLGILTGVFWVAPGAGAPLSGTHIFAVASWVLFAAVLFLRMAAGWRGRRAAIGTILGFVCAMAVLIGYAVRDLGVS